MKIFEVNENSTATYTATIKDEDGNLVALSDLNSITLTYYNLSDKDKTIINSRNNQNVKNANNVSIHATSGLLTWELQTEDTEIQDQNKKNERHRALFVFDYSGGSKKGIHEFDIDIINISKI